MFGKQSSLLTTRAMPGHCARRCQRGEQKVFIAHYQGFCRGRHATERRPSPKFWLTFRGQDAAAVKVHLVTVQIRGRQRAESYTVGTWKRALDER